MRGGDKRRGDGRTGKKEEEEEIKWERTEKGLGG